MNTTSSTARVALIFGGDGYLGSIVASAFEQSGWVAVRASRKTSDDTLHVSCDIGDSASVVRAFDNVIKNHGRIDACIHTASPALERVPFIASSPDSFLHHMQTAVLGTMYIAKSALAAKTKNIVVITSKATDASAGKMGAYPFAKKMQHELCATLAHTLPEGIRIHEVAPGFLPGGLNNDLPQAVRESLAKDTDGAHVIAHTIVAICEQEPKYTVNGTVDGETGELTPF